jgi:hypothetical protein
MHAQEPPPPERLSAASGLVPVFHVPSLLAQSASGKQRKILFFRKVSGLLGPKSRPRGRKMAKQVHAVS